MGLGIRWRSVASLKPAAVAFVLAFSTAPVAAGEISELAAGADDLIRQGKPAEALDAFDKATEAFWAASPLLLRTALFATSVQGFGQYEPRPGAAFRSGETAVVYVEPFGYGFAADGASVSVTFTAGIEVRTPGGLTLAKADDFGRLHWQGHTRSRSVHAAITVSLPALKAGDYRLVVTLTDSATAKSSSVTLPFSIVE